jgi:hypothetical protein
LSCQVHHRYYRFTQKLETEVEIEAEVENSPHKAQKNTEIEGGSQKIEACRDAQPCVSSTGFKRSIDF